MPLYEYRCQACGAEEETLESFSAPSEHACPKCGSPLGMRRQLSKAGFVLSGGGWYASGYGAEPKADAKPEAKPKTGAQPAVATGDTPSVAAVPAPAAPSKGNAGA